MRIYGHTEGSIADLAARLQGVEVSLRWGGAYAPGSINGEVALLDGLNQLRTMQGAGIAVPEFTTELATAEAWRQAGALVLGRKVEHTQGKDIRWEGQDRLRRTLRRGRVGAPRLRDWRASDFFVKYMPSLREWRFHIFKGESIGRGLKSWAGPGPEPTAAPLVRSRRLGWHMVHNVQPPKGARTFAKAAVAAVGYELGAVDMLELADGSYIALEVNSRPAIRDEYTIAAYAAALRQLAAGRP